MIQIRNSNPQIYLLGGVIKVPIHLIVEHQLVSSADSLTLYSMVDGGQVLPFLLSVRLASSERVVLL